MFRKKGANFESLLSFSENVYSKDMYMQTRFLAYDKSNYLAVISDLLEIQST